MESDGKIIKALKPVFYIFRNRKSWDNNNSLETNRHTTAATAITTTTTTLFSRHKSTYEYSRKFQTRIFLWLNKLKEKNNVNNE